MRRTINESFFVMHVSDCAAGKPKVAIIVPKRVAKNAVQRNLVKRRLSEALRISGLRPKALDITVVARSSILRKGFQEIKETIEQSIKKI